MTHPSLIGIHTSTIGSFPLEDNIRNRKRCIDDLLDIGIDFPTYPQLSDMGKQFLDDLIKQDCGITKENGAYKLKNGELNQDIEAPGMDPFNWTVDYLAKTKKKNQVKLKAALTGPFTLSSYIRLKPGSFPSSTALSEPQLVKEITELLTKSCKAASKHSTIISIDEPILSLIVGKNLPFKYTEMDITNTYDRLKSFCGTIATGTHICGSISPKLAEILLATKLDFLSHEFHDSTRNLTAYDPNTLKEHSKILSVGCLSSKNCTVETEQDILKTMSNFKKFGKNLIFTPDCGFKHLVLEESKEKGYKIAIQKLRHLASASEEFKKT